MKLFNQVFLFVFFAVAIVSCKVEVQPEPFFGYDYFPDSVGHYIIYKVDSIWTDDAFNRKDTYEFGLKEYVESMFTDNEGRPSQRIERYKDFSVEPYSFSNISDVWFATRTEARAEKIEENVRYVKLIFPLQNDKQWDGNAFNTEEDYGQEYKMMNVHEPFTVPVTNITFDSTVTVLQIDWQPAFDYSIYKLEVYALNVGLVYKEYYNVSKQQDNQTGGFLFYGAQYKYYYMEHGYE